MDTFILSVKMTALFWGEYVHIKRLTRSKCRWDPAAWAPALLEKAEVP